MKVSEIFTSIDGEGIRTGYPVTFIRLHGCNLRCSYCDSMYAVEGRDYTEMSVFEIVEECKKFSTRKVTLTGGEPLIHQNVRHLILMLIDEGFEVNIETNGAVLLKDKLSDLNVEQNKKLIITMDWKSASSGESDKMIYDNLEYLAEQDVLKFVVGNHDDLEQMKQLIVGHNPKCNIFVSPIFGKIEAKDIVDYIITNHLDNVRIQLQLHKFIWESNMRGV